MFSFKKRTRSRLSAVVTSAFILSQVLAQNALAFDQYAYQWRNDDGNEAAATDAADADTPIVVDVGETKRVRFGVANTDPLQITREDGIPLGYADSSNQADSAIDTVANMMYIGTADNGAGRIIKYDLTTKTRVAGIDLQPYNMYFGAYSLAVDQPGGFLYVGTGNGKVLKVSLATFTIVAETQLSSGLASAVVDSVGGFAYFGDLSGNIHKVNLATFTEDPSSPMSGCGTGALYTGLIDTVGQKAYFVNDFSNPATVAKVDLATFTCDGSLTLDSGDAQIQSGVIDPAGAFAYFGTETFPGKIVKVDLANMTRVGSIAPGGGFSSGVIDATGAFAYFGGGTSVAKIDLSSFSTSSLLSVAGEDIGLNSAVYSTVDSKITFISLLSDPDRMVTVDTAPFSQELPTVVLTDHMNNAFGAGVVDLSTGFGYVGVCPNNPATARIAKVDLATMTVVDTLILPPDHFCASTAVIDTTGPTPYAYFGTVGPSSNGLIEKINLTSFTLEDTLTTTGSNYLRSSIIDLADGFMYFGDNQSPARISKIDIASFTEDGASPLTLNSGEDTATAMVLDDSGATHFAYVGTSTDPGRIVKINLSTFTRVSAVTASNGMRYIRAGAIDTAGGLAYFGGETDPARVAKFDLSTFTEVDSVELQGNNVLSMSIDPADDTLIVGLGSGGPGTTSQGRAVRLRLSDFSVQGSALGQYFADGGEESFATSFIDAANDLVYFATNTSPAYLLKFSYPAVSSQTVPYRLEFSPNADTCDNAFGWTTIPAVAAGEAWELSDSTFIVDGEPTTASHIPPNGTFVPGEMHDTTSQTAPIVLTNAPDWTTIEFSVRPTADAVAGADYCFRLVDADGLVAATYAEYAVAALPLAGELEVTAPNGGEQVPAGSQFEIGWIGVAHHFRLSLSTDSGATYPTEIADDIIGNTYDWSVPFVSTQTARVRVEALTEGDTVVGSDESDADFTMGQFVAVQSEYRWRNDDGSEAAATAAKPQGSPLTGLETGDQKRLRLGVEHSGLPSDLARVAGLTLNEQNIEDSGVASVIDQANGFAYVATSQHIVKIDLATFTRVDAIRLEGDENSPHAGVIDLINGFAYFSVQSSAGEIVKIDLSSFSRVPSVLNLSVNNPNVGFIDDTSTYAYWSADEAPGRLAKVDLATFTEVDVLTFSGAGAGRAVVYDGVNEVAYVGTHEQNQKEVIKVDLATFTQTDLIDINCSDCGFANGGEPTAVIDIANQMAYFGVFTDNSGSFDSAARIYRIDLSPFSVVDFLQMDFGNQERYLDANVIDTVNGFAYFGASNGSTSARVVKIDLATFTRDSDIVMDAGEDYLKTAFIDPVAGFAYFSPSATPGRLVKIDLDPFARVDDLEFGNDVGDIRLQAGVIDSAAGFAYLGTATNPARVVKIDLSTLTRVGAVDMPDGVSSIESAVIDTAAGFAYFGTNGSPGVVIKIDLSTFTLAGTLELDSGEENLRAATIDTSGLTHFAYFGTFTNPGRVVKINLTTFTHAGALTLDSGDNQLRSAAIDPAAGYAYFGTIGFPRRLIKIDLSSFTRVDAIQEDGSDGIYRSMAIDPADGYLLVGTSNNPARIIKFNLTTFTRDSHVDLDGGEGTAFSMDLDPVADIAYIGGRGFPFPSFFAAVDADAMQRTGGFELDSGENDVFVTLFDPTTNHVYLGTNSEPSFIIKIKTATSIAFRLEVANKGASCDASTGWTQLPTLDWLLFDTTHYVDGTPSTNVSGVLSDPTASFTPGELKDVSSETSSLDLPAGTFTELEFAVQYAGTTGDYCFRLIDAGPDTFVTYASYAEATTTVPPPPGGGGSTPPSVTVVQPNGGETLNGNSSYNIVWSSGGTAPSSYHVSYSTDGGTAWTVIGSTASNSLSWNVPNISTSTARVRVEALDGSNIVVATDDSNGNFTIVPTSSTPPPSDPPPSEPPPTTPPPPTHDFNPPAEAAKEPTIDEQKGLVRNPNPKCNPGTLFRGTLATVYYCGIDGVRYPFPNAKTYFTWYPDFSGVQRVTNAFISSVPVGSYVTYKPGVKMVKLNTDPKTYGVAEGATLRHMATETVARDVYGIDWNQKIDDVPAPFWSDYRIGPPVN